MHTLIHTLLSVFPELSYMNIGILMAMESSIIPVPSELVMIPAGILVRKGELDMIGTILAGGIGSVIGALANYYILGKWLGKEFLIRWGRYILITPEKYHKTECLFRKNDQLYTFIGRLIPVVRHLISIPAGIFHMPLLPFISITFCGATLWCAILAGFGYYTGPYMEQILAQYSNQVGFAFIVGIGIYIWWKIFRT